MSYISIIQCEPFWWLNGRIKAYVKEQRMKKIFVTIM